MMSDVTLTDAAKQMLNNALDEKAIK